MLTLANIDYFQESFFHKLDDNKLLYKCAKFQVNSFCGLDFSKGGEGRGGGGKFTPPPPPPMHNRAKLFYFK